jgi:hypothetical protein
VRAVIRDGFPPSIQDLIQELGRAGRRPDASTDTDEYVIITSLDMLVSLLYRIFITPALDKAKEEKDKAIAKNENQRNNTDAETAPTHSSANTEASPSDSLPPSERVLQDEALSGRLYNNLVQVVRLLVLDNGTCVHKKLELCQLNPFVEPNLVGWDSCGNACWTCMRGIDTIIHPPLHRQRTTRALVDIFLIQNNNKELFSLHKCKIVSTIANYKVTSGTGEEVPFHVLAFQSTNKSIAKNQIKCLVMKLFACKILQPEVDGTALRFKLRLCPTNGSPVINDVEAWAGIHCVDDEED